MVLLIAHGAEVVRALQEHHGNAMFTTATPMEWPSNVALNRAPAIEPPGGLRRCFLRRAKAASIV
jgi:hypothetical protein